MAICNIKDMLQEAEKNKKAVGAFNVANIEMIRGVIGAAEELDVPVILQFTGGWDRYVPVELIGAAMVSAAKKSKVDVAVHLDHGRDCSIIEKAVEIGFSSVMFDGSQLPYEKNARVVRSIADSVKAKGISVEAELGCVGGAEGGKSSSIKHTDPEMIEEFCAKSGADALAVAIGNAHGNYTFEPELDFRVLEASFRKSPVPLVLHGGTGLTKDDYQKCIRRGISKINIATANFAAVMKNTRMMGYCEVKKDYFSMTEEVCNAVYKSTAEYIKMFNFMD